jgi:beta-phosphoglucomutase-like phosphatase (HAD superfamily)
MNDYAKIKGSAAPVPTAPAADSYDPAELTDAQRERIAAKRDQVRELMPELIPFIRELQAEGLIDGWRAVISVTPLQED